MARVCAFVVYNACVILATLNGNIAIELNITIMKKLLSFLGALLIAISAFAQNFETYVGKSKIYMWPLHVEGIKYAACMSDWVGDYFNNTYYFNSISIYNPSERTFHTYSSKHGKYVAFQLFYNVMTGRKDHCEQVAFWSSKGSGSGCYAFVVESHYLHIVDVQTDAIISTLISNFQRESDFSIIVDDQSGLYDSAVPSFWVMNSGWVKIYNGFPPAASVRSVTVERGASGTTYNLEGVEVSDPTSGVYLQDGKKVVIKK